MQELNHVHLGARCAYEEVVIRRQERLRAAVTTVRATRGTMLRLLRHWMHSGDADSDQLMPGK